MLKRKINIRDEARFQILRLLHQNPSLTQRELSGRLGISLGAVNYCLKALVERGLLEAEGFRRHPTKIGYAYLLTAAGVAEKTALTRRFLLRKIVEYEALKSEIDVLEQESSAEPVPWPSSDAEGVRR